MVTILTLVLFAVVPVLAKSATPGGGQTGSLAGVAPVLAQDATATPSGGQTGQGGNTVVLSTNETLGILVSRYQLSGPSLRDFLSANTDLLLIPGQQVVFPAGIAVTIPTTGQGTATAVATSTAAGVGVATATGTLAATTVAGGTAANTSTPVATTAAGGTAANTSTPVATTAAGGTTGGTGQAQTYVIQEGDTLGTLLNIMDFQAGTPGGATGAVTSTPAATLAATIAATPAVVETATTAASPTVAATATTAAVVVTEVATTAAGAGTAVATTAAGVLATETGTPAVTLAATVAASPTVAATATTAALPTVAATATTATGGTVPTTGGPTDDQLLQFVNSNSNLRFGVLVALPAGIPATGPGTGTGAGAGTTGTGAGTGTTGTGTVAEPVELTGEGLPVTQPLSGLSGEAASEAACSTGAPKGFGYYKVQGGDTLESISDDFGVDISRILELNPGAGFGQGSVILLPGVEAPGEWNVEQLCGDNEEFPGAENTPTG